MLRIRLRILGIAVSLVVLSTSTALDWRHYGGDPGGTRYSPLAQIRKDNVRDLGVAWEYDTGDYSDGTRYPSASSFEATPLLIDGVLYVPTVFHRLLALDPETGKQLWEFDPKFDRSIRVNLFTSRGLAYWSDGTRKRIYLGDQEGRLFSIDLATGKPDPEFGNDGILNLREGMAEKFPDSRYGLTSPVAVCRNVVVTGAWVSDGAPQGPSGDIRGFDARTGKLLWRFHTVPRPGEFGHDTWEGDSWKDRGGVNVWSMMSVDEENGLVFAPLTSPAYDYYGGDRRGANLFGDALLALDCETGKRRWHFQTIHHDLWDWDLPAQPNLVTVTRDGRQVPAVAQVTKMGFLFLFERLTGKPLFAIEERPVPKSDIPGEESWPTQPFPVKPRPFARQSMTPEEITDVTPESRRECLEMVRDAVVDGPLYRPIGRKLTVMFPGTNGGPNWGGASFDPTTQTLYVNSMDVAALFQMVERPEGSDIPWRARSTRYGRFWDSNQYPCQKPPWGTLTAIDLNSGEFRWQSVLGEFEELTKRGVPKTGTPNLGGSIVTAGGLIFIGATNDSRFRAFDKDTGEELWVDKLPASAHATPMTYLGKKTGKQFVVIAAGGGNKYNKTFSGKLVAYALQNPPVYRGKEEKLPVAVAPQPFLFSHKIHAGAGLKCAFCHGAASSRARAGIPTLGECAACHSGLEKKGSAIQAFMDASRAGRDAEWIRVYQLPDYVFFNHAEHHSAAVGCGDCHGPVETRDVLQKEVSTSMNVCMNCHAARDASNDCHVCHELGR